MIITGWKPVLPAFGRGKNREIGRVCNAAASSQSKKFSTKLFFNAGLDGCGGDFFQYEARGDLNLDFEAVTAGR